MKYMIMLLIVLLLAASDFLTGLMKAYVKGDISSGAMRRGGINKLGELTVMLTACGLEIGIRILGQYYNSAILAAVAGTAAAGMVFLYIVSMELVSLLAFARERGCSVGDLDMQVDFLLHELRTSYPAVWRTLTTVDNVRVASDAVMIQFERPTDTSETARRRRAKFGVQFYDKLAGMAQDGNSELSEGLQSTFDGDSRHWETDGSSGTAPPCPEQCPDTAGVRMLADEIRAGTWGTDWEMNVTAVLHGLVR